jgi:hypothetical protein
MQKRMVILTLVLSIGLFILNAALSLGWRFQHDSPIVFYITWLMDRFGYVPYRDIFDMNMPGTYAFNYVIGKISGFSNLGVRCVDLSILGVTMAFSWSWMKSLGSKVAVCGAVLWGLCYLQLGSAISLQREYLILVPVLGGVVIADDLHESHTVLKALACGFLFGVAASMKPQAAIALPFLLFLQRKDKQIAPFLLHVALPAAIGFSLPIEGFLLYLLCNGALTPFFDMVWNYLPLYSHLSGDHQTLSGMERWKYLWREAHAVGGFGLWLIPAVFGAYVSIYRSTFTSSQKRKVMLLIVLAFCYGLYPLIAGQLWDYHWLLFLYFILQLSALCIAELAPHIDHKEKLVPVGVLLLCIVLWAKPPEDLSAAILGRDVLPIKDGRVDEIAEFLQTHMQPGDRVQPLDWTGGAVHAMLISEARLATPFVYDFHFYHHTSNAYIQGLRKRFIESLQQSHARFIVQITSNDKPWVYGEDTTREFRELQSLLDESYIRVSGGRGYSIYQLRTDP